ncbi:MAG: pantoate--beta-alanine ligase [Acidimicrobiia bacterium]
MRTFTTIDELRRACDAARSSGRRVGLVPTMGFFHVGHRSLMDVARRENDFVVVSLFVNPSQFGPNEDLASYPRDPEGDAALVSAAGVDALFVPSVEEMYPGGTPRTTVHVAGLTEGMCGASRPGHFDGVTTIVAKLFAIVGPSRAYFGRKDFQQVAVVRRMARDLDLPVEVVGCPLVREADGLARSSRNVYLSAAERAAAPELHAALVAAGDAVRAGERSADALADLVRSRVARRPELRLEYVEIRDVDDLESLVTLGGEFVIALAASAGRARLIDNVVVAVRGAEVTVDVGVRP